MPFTGRKLASKPTAGPSFPVENAWWKMDEGVGSVAFDSSGNGYDGTLFDGASFAGDYVILGGNPPADRVEYDKRCSIANAEAATLTMEVYFTDFDTDRCFLWSEDTTTSSAIRFGLRTNSSNKLELLVRDAAREPAGTAILIQHPDSISTSTWHFVAMRMDSVANTVAVWFGDNKQELTSLTLGPFGTSTSSNIFSGDYSTVNSRRRANMRNIRQYLVSLTDQQIDDIRLGNV